MGIKEKEVGVAGNESVVIPLRSICNFWVPSTLKGRCYQACVIERAGASVTPGPPGPNRLQSKSQWELHGTWVWDLSEAPQIASGPASVVTLMTFEFGMQQGTVKGQDTELEPRHLSICQIPCHWHSLLSYLSPIVVCLLCHTNLPPVCSALL